MSFWLIFVRVQNYITCSLSVLLNLLFCFEFLDSIYIANSTYAQLIVQRTDGSQRSSCPVPMWGLNEEMLPPPTKTIFVKTMNMHAWWPPERCMCICVWGTIQRATPVVDTVLHLQNLAICICMHDLRLLPLDRRVIGKPGLYTRVRRYFLHRTSCGKCTIPDRIGPHPNSTILYTLEDMQ